MIVCYVVIEGMLGLSFAKPFSHMREYLAVLAPPLQIAAIRAGIHTTPDVGRSPDTSAHGGGDRSDGTTGDGGGDRGLDGAARGAPP